MKNTINLDTVQQCINYHFQDVKLLRNALTHSSFANEWAANEWAANATETPDAKEQGAPPPREDAMAHNERLEFLGDAVLELCVSEELFRRFPDVREGELTRMRAKLVSRTALGELAKELQLGDHLLLGRGEESQGGRQRLSLLADVFEAVVGAVFLDGGFAALQAWTRAVYARKWPGAPDQRTVKDYKSALQELTQLRYKARPVYALAESSGPEHAKEFAVTLILPDNRRLTGRGRSVKKAEQQAAGKALAMLEDENDASS